MKNIVLYHRASSIHTDLQIREAIEILTHATSLNDNILSVWERADNVLSQDELVRTLGKIAKGEIKCDEIVAISLNTLVNCPFVEAMEKLILLHMAGLEIRFINPSMSPTEVIDMINTFQYFNVCRLNERNQLSSYRMRQNGTLVGRRPRQVDQSELIKLREQDGLSFKAIAERLSISVSLVYSKMPKHLKGCLDEKTRRRIEKMRAKLRLKEKEEKEGKEEKEIERDGGDRIKSDANT